MEIENNEIVIQIDEFPVTEAIVIENNEQNNEETTDQSDSSDESEDSSSDSSDSANDNIETAVMPTIEIVDEPVECGLNANARPFIPGCFPNPMYVEKSYQNQQYHQPPQQQKAEPITPGNELSTHELAQLCAFMDNDEYPDAEIDPDAIEAILEKTYKGGAIFDSSEARYRENNRRDQDPNRVTDEELWAVIQISEGDVPMCSPAVLESALKKVSQGLIKLEKDQNAVQRVVEHLVQKVDEQVEEIAKTSWWDYVPFSGMFSTKKDEKITKKEKTEALPVLDITPEPERVDTLRQRHAPQEKELLLNDTEHLKKGKKMHKFEGKNPDASDKKHDKKHDPGCLIM